mmetsp:Transcript_28271/g.72081  ORF Transcript_28271/g.72081 Transcript_28271/m.72081 type:complete len:225 (+) Transcript_28271:2180-2854(+)
MPVSATGGRSGCACVLWSTMAMPFAPGAASVAWVLASVSGAAAAPAWMPMSTPGAAAHDWEGAGGGALLLVMSRPSRSSSMLGALGPVGSGGRGAGGKRATAAGVTPRGSPPSKSSMSISLSSLSLSAPCACGPGGWDAPPWLSAGAQAKGSSAGCALPPGVLGVPVVGGLGASPLPLTRLLLGRLPGREPARLEPTDALDAITSPSTPSPCPNEVMCSSAEIF